jgi:hypothetical protein
MTTTTTEFPIMKGNARMATGASDYFEVPLFSHVIDNLWQGCSPAEFPDLPDYGRFWTPFALYEGVNCKWLYTDSYDAETGDPGPPVPRFDKIMNLFPWGKYVVPELTEMVEITAFDGSEIDFDIFKESALRVIEWLNEGHQVLVHCQAGLNRSSFVIALILMEKYKMSPDEAINHIRKSRSPLCLCNDHFRQYLEGLK